MGEQLMNAIFKLGSTCILMSEVAACSYEHDPFLPDGNMLVIILKSGREYRMTATDQDRQQFEVAWWHLLEIWEGKK